MFHVSWLPIATNRCRILRPSTVVGDISSAGPSMMFGGFAYNGISFLFRSGAVLGPTYVVGWGYCWDGSSKHVETRVSKQLVNGWHGWKWMKMDEHWCLSHTNWWSLKYIDITWINSTYYSLLFTHPQIIIRSTSWFEVGHLRSFHLPMCSFLISFWASGMAASFCSALYLTFTSAIIDFNLARLSPKAKEGFAAMLGETLIYARRSYALCLAMFMMAFTVRIRPGNAWFSL